MNLTPNLIEHVNKSGQLKQLAQQYFLKMFAEIRWDPSTFLKEVETILRPCSYRDAFEVFSFSSFTFKGEVKAVSNVRSIDGVVIVAHKADRFIDILAQEARSGAETLANQVLETMGTSFSAERDRWYKNAREQASRQVAPTHLIIPPALEDDVHKFMQQLNQPNYGALGMPPIVTDPKMPKDQVAFMSNGKLVGMAKNVHFDEYDYRREILGEPFPEEEEETLESALRRRRKDAPWK